MNIKISGKNVDTGTAFREHAEAALKSAVDKYFPNAVSGSITLTKGVAGFDVQLMVFLTKRMDMEANGSASDAHAALDIAVNHIEKRLRRYKRKLKNYRHDNSNAEDILPATLTVFSPKEEEASDLSGGDENDKAAPAILAEMDYPVHLLSLEEAIMQFELSGQPALLFRNRLHMGLNMLHRRDDGSIGWVDPRGNRQGVDQAS